MAKEKSEAADAAEAPSLVLRTVQEWAEAKGHVPKLPKVVRHRGDAIHSAPHIKVIRQHTGWPSNRLVSEAEYDSAAHAAYNLPIRES